MALNNNSIQDIAYDDSFEGIIAGENRDSNYVVIVKDRWISGILETSTRYIVGNIVRIRPSLVGSPVIFTEDD
jgi:hypothetical protein